MEAEVFNPEIVPGFVVINEESKAEHRKQVYASSPFASKINDVNIMMNRMQVLIGTYDDVYFNCKKYAAQRDIILLNAAQEPALIQQIKPLEDAAYWMDFHSKGLHDQAELEYQKLIRLRNSYKELQEAWADHKVNMWVIETEKHNKRVIAKWKAQQDGNEVETEEV